MEMTMPKTVASYVLSINDKLRTVHVTGDCVHRNVICSVDRPYEDLAIDVECWLTSAHATPPAPHGCGCRLYKVEIRYSLAIGKLSRYFLYVRCNYARFMAYNHKMICIYFSMKCGLCYNKIYFLKTSNTIATWWQRSLVLANILTKPTFL